MSGASLADRIDQTLSPVSDVVSSIVFVSVDIAGVSMPLVVAWLMAGGVFMTIAFRFLNLTGFRHAWSVVARRRDDHKGDGEITHFEALSAALSGTVGLGNIASVPVAIVLGGPGAIFWMVLAGFFGMTLKFAECTMAVKYRRVQSDGRVIGGPMYYIEAAFERIGAKAVGKGAALFFAVMTVGASISLFQINQSHAQFANVTGLAAPVAYGVIMSSLVALVVLGGVRRVGRVASMLVPFMAVIYVAAGLFIIMANITALPGAIALIFESAFGLDAAGGGIIGALINGMKRATYSSEAGVGSAAIVHASVKTDNPLTEGHVALLEPFIDTVVVCTITGLVVVVTGVYEPFLFNDDVRGIEITSSAFATAFDWFPIILLVASVLFAFSSVLSWVHYGAQAVAYAIAPSKIVDVTFKVLICMVLATGAAVSLSSVIDFIDSMLFAMSVPNIIALYILLPELKRDLKAYRAGLRA